jgi:LuxR family maltose regulon positive regulatory protein
LRRFRTQADFYPGFRGNIRKGRDARPRRARGARVVAEAISICYIVPQNANAALLGDRQMSQVPATSLQNVLVHTKLRRPRTVGQIVRRPRLLDQLHHGMFLPLTVVSAPPGYGKTTLVSLWLDEVAVPWAWYSVDAQDSALDIFVAYLAAAIVNTYPGCGATLQALLHTPSVPQPERLADIFVGELSILPGELLMILDDYHLIVNPEIHDFMASVIRNAPAGVRFLLLGRADPPLKLARLRARQQMHEVRAAQLRFTIDETRELMHRIMGNLATEATVALFTERTEGWPAGVHLAATSMRNSDNASEFATGLSHSGSQAIADFLVSEVLELLAPQERDLLLRTSILQRFCAPLCGAIISPTSREFSGEAFLNRLRSMNLFLVALDDDGIWYRFHHLFAQILRHHLRLAQDNSAIGELHGAASRWFEEQGLLDEAVTHALQSGDPLRAPRLVEAYTDTLLNSENWRTLERWLAALPEAQKHRPAVLAAFGWVEQFRVRPAAILNLVQEAEARLLQNDEAYSVADVESIRGAILTLRAVANMHAGNWELAQRFAEQSLPFLADERAFVRGICDLAYLRATLRLGDPERAIGQAEIWLREQKTKADARTMRLMLALCSIYYDRLRLDELNAAAQAYRHMALEAQRPVSAAWAAHGLGFVCYQRNEPALAQTHFSQIVLNRHEAHVRTVVDSWIGLCLSLQAQGLHAEACRQIQELRNFLLQEGRAEWTQTVDATAIYLQLLAGEHVRVRDDFAQGLPRQLGIDVGILPLSVWALSVIRSNEREQQAAVAARLSECRTLLAADIVPRRLIEVELLDALLYAAQGNHKAALAAVRSAVALAEPGGALRYFVDFGPELKPYLQQLTDLGVAQKFTARILAAYAPEAVAPAPLAVSGAVAQEDESVLFGPDQLSNRELDVLLLLERRLSNQEIGELLFISTSTVKRHTISIYSKLQVHSRRAAVARARMLGIMPLN